MPYFRECEGCRCHGWLQSKGEALGRFRVARRAAPLARAEYDGPASICPLAGKNAVKLASGRLASCIQEAFATLLVVAIGMCAGIQAGADVVIDDFQTGSSIHGLVVVGEAELLD